MSLTVHHYLAADPLEGFIIGEKKIRKATGGFTPEFCDALLEAADYRCVYCGAEIAPDSMHVDHIVARSKGGGHDLLNLAPSCCSCNSAKGARPLQYLRVVLALRESPIAGVISPMQAIRLTELGVELPIDAGYRFHFEKCIEAFA